MIRNMLAAVPAFALVLAGLSGTERTHLAVPVDRVSVVSEEKADLLQSGFDKCTVQVTVCTIRTTRP